jgi:hypothetical protein
MGSLSGGPFASCGGQVRDDRFRKTRRAGLRRPALQISMGPGVMSDLKVRPPNEIAHIRSQDGVLLLEKVALVR